MFHVDGCNVCVNIPRCKCVSERIPYIFECMLRSCEFMRLACMCACFHVMCICAIRSAVYGVPFEGPNNWWIVFLSRDVIRFMYELLCESGDGDGASPCVINYLAFVCVRGMGSVVWLKLYVCGGEKVRCAVRGSYFLAEFPSHSFSLGNNFVPLKILVTSHWINKHLYFILCTEMWVD